MGFLIEREVEGRAVANDIPVRSDVDARIVRGLNEEGSVVIDGYHPAPHWQRLLHEARAERCGGGFRAAGVGRAGSWQLRPEIRSDYVRWLDPRHAMTEQRAWLGRMETLRQRLNRELYLGLFGFEAHLALYPPGAFYATHLDRFSDAATRVVSTLLYLNEDWQEAEGGALRLYLEQPDAPPWRDVVPQGGTFVAFFSAELPHQVLPATRERWSVAGWFLARD